MFLLRKETGTLKPLKFKKFYSVFIELNHITTYITEEQFCYDRGCVRSYGNTDSPVPSKLSQT